jgi:hypothetical protein
MVREPIIVGYRLLQIFGRDPITILHQIRHCLLTESQKIINKISFLLRLSDEHRQAAGGGGSTASVRLYTFCLASIQRYSALTKLQSAGSGIWTRLQPPADMGIPAVMMPVTHNTGKGETTENEC